MPRLSIDITADEHQRLKAIASLKGQSIKDFVLSKTLDDVPSVNGLSDEQAMQTLADFLTDRAQEIEDGHTVEIASGGLVDYLEARAKERHGNA